jgi:redox-sensitive bicupin YhaK (pirin superfamily)
MEERSMTTSTRYDRPDTAEREIQLVVDARIRPMMGINVLESLPHVRIPYELVDPFILVHEAEVPITPQQASLDTEHPHRGFDNLWYLISGSASTGHTTGPGGTIERARLQAGSLLKIRTGRGVRHAEGIGEDEIREGKAGSVMRGVLFWVNLARKDKGVAPMAQVVDPKDVPVRQEGDATVRTLVGEGSPVELGTPGLILDVELPKGGTFSTAVPPEFNGFVYMLEGEVSLGADRRLARPPQIAVLGPGRVLTAVDAQPGTRFLLMAGKPYGETPIYNGPYVD